MAGKLYLITGSDTARIAERGREWVRELAGEDADAFALDVIREGDDITAANALGCLIQAILTPPFLAGHKLVWLKEFSAFKEEKAKGSGGALGALFDRLGDIFEAGIPDGVTIVVSGAGIDKRKRLFKLCGKVGEVEVLDKPDIKQRDWRNEMARLLRERAAAKGLRLTAEAGEHLISIVGTETAAIDTHLEKLRCYLGEDGVVSGELAQLLCQGDGETVFWAVSDAVMQRDLTLTLGEIEHVLSLEKDPDNAVRGVVRQVANVFRQMLQARVLMLKLKVAGRQLSRTLQALGDERKVALAMEGLEIVGIHPYRCQKLAEKAENYSGQELIAAVVAIRDVEWHCVTSGADKRVALESMLARTL